MKKRNFSAEFKRESAQLVVDQNYTVADAAKAMDIGLSTMTRWVKQLRDERQGKTPKASPITPEQIEIRELRKKLQRIEMENEILKKATVDSIGQRNSYVKTWGCGGLNRPGFPGECFICELRLPDHRFRWKHNKLFLLLPVGYGPAFPAIVDCYTSPPT
ncbi:CP4-6 prophage; partial regulator of insertion element IS911A [Escherichia coli]|nr:transposase insN for insertion sequence element IS911 [Escherichia coli HVH 79 (4-2512823)]STL36849.1 CP4-6 prophage; partial regulator of insertion element IS911A [Escherichia coli]